MYGVGRKSLNRGSQSTKLFILKNANKYISQQEMINALETTWNKELHSLVNDAADLPVPVLFRFIYYSHVLRWR